MTQKVLLPVPVTGAEPTNRRRSGTVSMALSALVFFGFHMRYAWMRGLQIDGSHGKGETYV